MTIMDIKKIGLAVIAVLAVGLLFVAIRDNSSQSTDDPERSESISMEEKDSMKMEDGESMEKEDDDHNNRMEGGEEYTLEEISQHDSADDCWMAIEGGVYDVTEFIAGQKHPGGAAVLEGCGIDATELFMTRPMGSGTPHSSSAHSFLENFQIGNLAE